MPTRKKKGTAGKCTLPAGFVHNHARKLQFLGFGVFFRFLWSFARVCGGLLFFFLICRFLWDFDRRVLMLKCLGLFLVWPIFGILVGFV